MDTNYEDKMYQQIEKSLSNNINDRLFVPIEMISNDNPTYTNRKRKHVVDSVSYEEGIIKDEPILARDSQEYHDRVNNNELPSDIKDAEPRLSRAEYIMQAREACLRKMNSMDTGEKTYDYYIGKEDTVNTSLGRKKRDKTTRLFNEGSEEEDYPGEIASYRSLIIRTVCAAAIFLCIFVIDKVKVDLGTFSYNTIRQYVTGNNQLKALEEIIITWLK